MSTVTSAFGSSRRLDEARAQLIDRVVSAFAPEQQVVAASYFELLAAEDVVVRPAQDFIDIISAHLALGANRTPGTANVKAFTPADEFAHSVVQIVTDDMPFLVDSVTAELTRLGSGIHVLYHPRFAVGRDVAGTLTAIADPKSELEIAESWICVEFTRETDDADLRTLEVALRNVLGDVRAAVTDWPEMRSRAFELASVLRSSNSSEAALAVDFLNWLVADHFTFVGYAHYQVNGGDLVLNAQSALGTLRNTSMGDPLEGITLARLGSSDEHAIMLVTKANTRSTVHRPTYLDYVGVREFDSNGNIVGVHRFIGLLTASAYTSSISTVPLISQKAAAVIAELGLGQNTHSGKDLQQFLETYPRDDMFQISVSELTAIAREALRLQERRQVRAFMRVDNFSRFASFLVYFPRDRYTTAVRMRMEAILLAELGAAVIDHSARVSESALARLHFVVHMPSGVVVPEVDVEHIENLLAQATRSWDDDFATALVVAFGEERALPLLRKWIPAFPESFKEDVPAEYAPIHLTQLEELLAIEAGEIIVRMYEPADVADGTRRFTIYRAGAPITLSSVLPMLHDLGVTVTDERAYELQVAGAPTTWIYDFGLDFVTEGLPALDTLAERFCESFLSTWRGQTDSDGFNALVLHAGLSARNAGVIRAYAAYLRQAGTPFSQGYLQQVLLAHVDIVQLLAKLFAVRFDTKLEIDRAATAKQLVDQINQALDAVASLDHDRILRSCVALVSATLRTNVYQKQSDGNYQQVMAFKLDPSQVPELPLPLPKFEVWVYSPRVEGVHLRFAAVARGGLRWSDRLEDFRTEILGLVKAQMVKNTVIVPSGAKGGFVVKRGPEPTDRDAWLAEGIACYQAFIGALLDVTDNLVDGQVVPPQDVVRHDVDDPYLVVAADKGTATFSDIANQISLDRGFWMGDAFASGGSVGYDHKGMGITARGAWESVKRHFLELGHDTQSQEFTAVGIGDMSGDVFGNGMLLSEHLRLVAAFDHRHIFLDPNPQAAVSFAERKRLFELPRSSWADYNTELLSAGGGIHSRTAKSIEITPEVREALGLAQDVTTLKPFELQAAILQAPVDLVWNGGIGTYLKASSESNAQVGDKANDALRINGNQIRAKVFGEGGNLGATQLGRIEAALNGVRLNTDAIDNSAGVDTSDHEVNIKILLDLAIASGQLASGDRTALLESMTDEVGQLVLRDNYNQNLILEQSRYQAPVMLSVHQRLLHILEAEANLNRAVEFLPDDAALVARAGIGLTSPELSVLMAYEKIRLANYRSADGLLEESWCTPVLRGYFPKVLAQKFGDLMERHPLRGEIISTVIVNDIVNRGGITFMMRAAEETGAGISEIARAYIVVREVFGFDAIWQQIEALDGVIDTRTQADLFLEMRRLLDRATRWFLHTRGGRLDVLGEQERFTASIAALAATIPGLLRGAEAQRFTEHKNRLVGKGVPEHLSATVASALDVFSLLDIVEIATKTGKSPADVAKLYFEVSERYEVDRLLVRITGLERADRWSAHARSALRSDLYAALAALVFQVITYSGDWEQDNSEGVARTRAMLAEIVSDETVGLANLSVALRAIRTLVG